jgi:DNA-3-methyladenine glycosylase I
VWSFKPEQPLRPHRLSDIPTRTDESKALATALQKAGFKFVGPTTIYAMMKAIGMVDAHLVGSHRRGTSGGDG